MSMVVSVLQDTFGVPKNNNALDHGNTNRLAIFAVISRGCVRKKYKGCLVEPNRVPDTHSPFLFPVPLRLLTHPFHYHAVP